MTVVTPCLVLSIRIHVLSGILNDSISADQAEEKFLTNIRLAADECAKVMNELCYTMQSKGLTVAVEVEILTLTNLLYYGIMLSCPAAWHYGAH